MKVKKAIDILQKQRDKVDNPKSNNNHQWISQTASYIKDFFGENSTEFSFITQFSFSVVNNGMQDRETLKRWMNDKPIEAKRFLNNCIETLQDKGLSKPLNFLQRFNDTTVLSLLILSWTAIWSFGFLFGQYTSDVKNFDLKQEVKQLKDSLSVFSNTPMKQTNSVIKKSITDTIKNKLK